MNEDIYTPVPFPPVMEGGKQSKIGIASFVVSILGVIIFCVVLVISVWYAMSIVQNNPTAAQNPLQVIDQSSMVFISVTILSWCGPILSLIGVVLGIVSIVQKKDKKAFGVIGLVIGGLFLLVSCLLLVFGLSMGKIPSLQ
jgi:magnesium-transporting ATPase (P-type)